jgi:predicted nucleotidyltransferase
MDKSKLQEKTNPQIIAREIAAQFAKLDRVEAVTLGGSLATGRASAGSDIDLYVYFSEPIPLEARARIIEPRSSQMKLDAPYWGTEDYWIEKESGMMVEAMYESDWPVDYLKDMFTNTRAHMGFTTSTWHSLAKSKVLFDRNGWFASVQKIADVSYPDSLVAAIIRKNFPLLRGSLIKHPKQLALAIARNDVIHIHHRIDMILACYFDIVFALNRRLHPGDKRMLDYALDFVHIPEGMLEDITGLLTDKDLTKIKDRVDQLIDRLERLLIEQGAL